MILVNPRAYGVQERTSLTVSLRSSGDTRRSREHVDAMHYTQSTLVPTYCMYRHQLPALNADDIRYELGAIIEFSTSSTIAVMALPNNDHPRHNTDGRWIGYFCFGCPGLWL